MHFATVFEIAPFQGWLRAFSLKSNLVWLDRDGLLSSGMHPLLSIPAAQGGNYLGIVPAIILGAILLLKPSQLYTTVTGKACRLCIALFLFLHWISFGPFSVLTGQLEFLKMTIMANDVAVPLSWLLFLVQPWIIFSLLPKGLAGRTGIGAALCAIYILVPGFRLIGWLPFYGDLRAPLTFHRSSASSSWLARQAQPGIFFFSSSPLAFPSGLSPAWRFSWPSQIRPLTSGRFSKALSTGKPSRSFKTLRLS